MSRAVPADVFSADELALAAGVSRQLVDAMSASGELQPLPGTRFFAADQAVRAGRRLRTVAAGVSVPLEPLFATLPDSGVDATGRGRLAVRENKTRFLFSSCVHAAVVVILLWATAGGTQTAPVTRAVDETRLVFLMPPGPGGGGGGGGTRDRLPAPRIERIGLQSARVTVPAVTPKPVITTTRREEQPPKPTPAVIPEPKPVEREPEPLPAKTIVAPVVAAASNTQDREGVIEHPQNGASQGTGIGGGAGSGQGTGNGEGSGSGIGEGSGGGTGGGPYRPGSGIEPPRLLREVKAEYTEDARRRGVTGDVELEIVVTRDGGVSEVRLVKGLGAGLDDRAVAAVRQWRFAPARRKGVPVDVIVEVAVEFTLR
jgi:protein TonB